MLQVLSRFVGVTSLKVAGRFLPWLELGNEGSILQVLGIAKMGVVQQFGV